LSFGRLTAGGSGLRRASLGDAASNSNSIRNAVTLTFPTGLFLPNGTGDDLVVYEQGDPNQSEAYAIAVRKNGDSTFSNFRYEIWDSQQTSVGVSPAATQIATGFDLTDFGLAAGEQIDAIIIENLRQFNAGVNSVVDYTPNGGSGFVVTVNGGGAAPSGYALPVGYGATKDGLFPLSEYDPDISYVGVLQPLAVAVPEAGSCLLVGAALAVAAASSRRHQRGYYPVVGDSPFG
jgi:hypothetical protein